MKIERLRLKFTLVFICAIYIYGLYLYSDEYNTCIHVVPWVNLQVIDMVWRLCGRVA